MKELDQERHVKDVKKGKRKISRKACNGCEGNYAHLTKGLLPISQNAFYFKLNQTSRKNLL